MLLCSFLWDSNPSTEHLTSKIQICILQFSTLHPPTGENRTQFNFHETFFTVELSRRNRHRSRRMLRNIFKRANFNLPADLWELITLLLSEREMSHKIEHLVELFLMHFSREITFPNGFGWICAFLQLSPAGPVMIDNFGSRRKFQGDLKFQNSILKFSFDGARKIKSFPARLDTKSGQQNSNFRVAFERRCF